MRAAILPVLTLLIPLMALLACSPAAAPSNREVEVQAQDVTLHARIAGNPEAEAVLIAIHGGPGNASDYMVSLEQLAGDDLAVVTYDQRGVGRSSEPSSGYAMDSYLADLDAVRQAAGADRAHLLGHSWGGLVALRYAVAYPERVQSIILAGSGVLDPQVAAAAQRNKAQRVEWLQEQGVIPLEISSLADMLPAYFSDPNFEMPDELQNMFYEPGVEQATWQALGNYDFAAGLDTLDMPVIVLWGIDDPFGMVYPEATKKGLPSAEVEVIVLPACGHYWHECPEPFLSAARTFLGQPPSP